jgi:hypothetical protein
MCHVRRETGKIVDVVVLPPEAGDDGNVTDE